MCELLGFTASRKTDISAYLKAFYAHSVQNPHGWGMMFEDGVRVILKEAVSANQSTFPVDDHTQQYCVRHQAGTA